MIRVHNFGPTQEDLLGGSLHGHARSSSRAHQLRFRLGATACLALWAGVLGFRDILDTVRCAVRELGMRNMWLLSVLL
jgi:hypothetical protein